MVKDRKLFRFTMPSPGKKKETKILWKNKKSWGDEGGGEGVEGCRKKKKKKKKELNRRPEGDRWGKKGGENSRKRRLKKRPKGMLKEKK